MAGQFRHGSPHCLQDGCSALSSSRTWQLAASADALAETQPYLNTLDAISDLFAAAEQALHATREERTQARRERPVTHIYGLAGLPITWDDRLVGGRARREATRRLDELRCGLAWVVRAVDRS
jgi:hypothetical protein